MKLETAKKILKDRAENFYGKTVAWLIDDLDRETKCHGKPIFSATAWPIFAS